MIMGLPGANLFGFLRGQSVRVVVQLGWACGAR